MKSGKYNSTNVDNLDQKEIDSQIRGDTFDGRPGCSKNERIRGLRG